MAGCILSGGQSTRMGEDKALVSIGVTSGIERLSTVLHSVFGEVFIVSDYLERYKFLDIPVYADIAKQSGPIAGLQSALYHSTAERVFVISVDLPLVTAPVIRAIARTGEDCEAVVPVVPGSGVQPLCGVYDKSVLGTVERRLASKRLSVKSLLEELRVCYWDAEHEIGEESVGVFLNMNTQKDVHLVRTILGQREQRDFA